MARPEYELREADREDLEWVVELAVKLAAVTVAPLRGLWGPAGQDFVASSVKQLIGLKATGQYRFLIASDKATGERVGYLILDLVHHDPTGGAEAFIEDMGIVSDYLGKRAGHFLTDQAARIAGEEGIDYLGAHISFSNRRALLAALGNGFELEFYRIVRPCTEQAKATVARADEALDFQQEAEQRRRVLLSRKIKRRQRQEARAKRRASRE